MDYIRSIQEQSLNYELIKNPMLYPSVITCNSLFLLVIKPLFKFYWVSDWKRVHSHFARELHLCILIPSLKIIQSLTIFSIGHLDRQFHTTYRSRGNFTGRTNSFRQLCQFYMLQPYKNLGPQAII
jgi:hypothetical protein